LRFAVVKRGKASYNVGSTLAGLKIVKIWNSFAVPGLAVAALLFAGCKQGSQTTPAEAAATQIAPETTSESQQVAEAVLGKQAEIVAHGDLARNGHEQLLVVNRTDKAVAKKPGVDTSLDMLITRAVIVQKDNDKWSEVLRCDEYVKNPRGYLGGSVTGPVTGWRLKMEKDTRLGLELRFTPAEAVQELKSNQDESGSRTIVVRWNTKTKRYQSLDQSHREYQDEVPALETPRSILK
jgi:hypothetical protein